MKMKNLFDLENIERGIVDNPDLTKKEQEILTWLFRDNQGDYEFKLCLKDGRSVRCQLNGEKLTVFPMTRSNFQYFYFCLYELDPKIAHLTTYHTGLREFRQFCSMLEIED